MRQTIVPVLFCVLSLASSDTTFSQTCVDPPSGLVSWWPGDGNASDIVDGNDGALENGATFAAGHVGQPRRVHAGVDREQFKPVRLPEDRVDRVGTGEVRQQQNQRTDHPQA